MYALLYLFPSQETNYESDEPAPLCSLKEYEKWVAGEDKRDIFAPILHVSYLPSWPHLFGDNSSGVPSRFPTITMPNLVCFYFLFVNENYFK